MPGPNAVSGSTSPSTNYDDYGVCYADDGADVTDYGDTTETSTATTVVVKDTPKKKPAATDDDFGYCEMSDEQYEAERKQQCKDDAAAARNRCYDAYASQGRPVDSWGQMCDEGARDMQNACEAGEDYLPDSDYDPLHTDSATQGEIGCSLEGDKAKADFTRRKDMADQRVCERRAGDGETTVEDCKSERRYGNATVRVQDSESHQDSAKEGWQKDEGGNRKTTAEGGWKAPIGFNGGVKHEEGRTWNDSKHGEKGSTDGTGKVVVRDYDRTHGWQKEADQLEKDTYGQCMEREGL